MKIHEIIRKQRKERGLTQEELARYLGVSAPAVNKWEKGQSYPDITLLPVLASYFNMSVDDLLGYEPQMLRSDIEKLYHRLAKRFSSEPFETVKEECDEYVKKYHSCFQLLLQMAVLYVNHWSMAPEPKEILEEAIGLLDSVIENSGEVQLAKEATITKGGCLLILERPQEVLDMLGSEVHAFMQDAEMQAQAYHMKGDREKAREALQVSMYQHLLMFVGDSSILASGDLETPEKADEVIRRTLKIMEVYHIEKLHFNVMAQAYLSFAQHYCAVNRPEDALNILERYANAVVSQEHGLELHGDAFFDTLDNWLSKLTLGKEPPRSEAVVRQSVLESVIMNPAYECLKGNARYNHIIKRLEDYCGKAK